MKRAILRASFLSMRVRGSKFFTSAAMRQAKAEASKPVMRSVPLLPASNACQTSSTLLPTAQMSPIPVTTTRRSKLLRSFRVGGNVVDGIPDGADLLRVFVRDLDFESFLEGHHQLDGVERIGAQVVHERGVGRNFALVYAQLLHNDLLYAFVYGCHEVSNLLSTRPRAGEPIPFRAG